MDNETKNRPVKTWKCGTVKAALWTNQQTTEKELLEFHSVTFERLYKVENEWKSSSSFGPEDLLKLATLATEIYKDLKLSADEPSKDDMEK